MTDRTRLHGLAVAIVVLVLSAGVTLAGGGPAPAADGGLAIASEASGKDVPVRAGWTQDDQTVDGADDEETDATEAEAPEAEETGAEAEHCTDVEPANHGSLVCWAAQNAPDGWEGTHGGWVSCVARLSNNGHAVEPEEGAEPEPIVWADLTPEACDEAIEAAKDAKAAEREAAKADREATKAERAAGRAERAANRAASKGH